MSINLQPLIGEVPQPSAVPLRLLCLPRLNHMQMTPGCYNHYYYYNYYYYDSLMLTASFTTLERIPEVHVLFLKCIKKEILHLQSEVNYDWNIVFQSDETSENMFIHYYTLRSIYTQPFCPLHCCYLHKLISDAFGDAQNLPLSALAQLKCHFRSATFFIVHPFSIRTQSLICLN